MAESGVLLLSAKELQGWLVPVIGTNDDVDFRPLSSLSNNQQKQIEDQIRLSLNIQTPQPQPQPPPTSNEIVESTVIDFDPFGFESDLEPVTTVMDTSEDAQKVSKFE